MGREELCQIDTIPPTAAEASVRKQIAERNNVSESYVARSEKFMRGVEIMEQMMVNAGIAIKDLPDGVQYHCRYADDGTAYGFYLNNTNEPQTISEVHGTDIQTKNIFDGKMELAPFGVSIIKENN